MILAPLANPLIRPCLRHLTLGVTSWGQILETMVMGNLGEWVNEVHYGLGENGKFLSFSFLYML